jgi:cbb3-type cytochrome oxidase maturation protein
MSGIMEFLFLLSGLFVALIIVGVFWSIRSGQFDDLEGPAERILLDDDDPRLPNRRHKQSKANDSEQLN